MSGGRSEGRREHGGPHGGHRRRGGPESWGGGWFMPFGPRPGWGGSGWGGPPRRTGKARRGDVRAAILSVLQDVDLNGYQVIQEIEERSGGAWKPSPGSVYPTLQQLEDEGLVVAGAPEGRRTYRLTEGGRRYAEEHVEELAAPWRAFAAGPDEESDEHELKPLVGQLMGALWQIMATGTPEQQGTARAALVDLRKTLFQILAEGDEDRPS
ncbi:MAG: PadR family transcriptional regulator [Propionibacteriaceae bacterium]